MSGETVRDAIRHGMARTGATDNRLIGVAPRIAEALGIDPDLPLDTLRRRHEILGELCEVIIWMSGSADFGPDGPAGEHWQSWARPLLFEALALTRDDQEDDR